MKRPTTEQVKAIHTDMIALTGGATGLRDAGMLESALEESDDCITQHCHKTSR